MIKKISYTIAASFLLFSNIACSSNSSSSDQKHRQAPEIEKTLETNIRTSGIKSFIYTETVQRSDRSKSDKGGRGGRGGASGGGGRGGASGGGRGGSSGGGGRGGRSGGDSANKEAKMEKMKIRAIANLEKELARIGYCREGYIEMDTEMHRGSFTIEGDCTERASQADRDKFTP